MSRYNLKVVLIFLSLGFIGMASSSDISEDTLIVRAILDEESGNFTESRNIYENLYQMTGKKEYIIQEAKGALAQRVEIQHSIDNLLNWIEENPTDNDVELYRMLVALYIQNGSLIEAEKSADKYLSLNPPVDDRIAVAALKLELDKPKESVDILLNAYKEDENQKALIQAVSIMLKELDRKAEATKLLEDYISKHKDASVATYFKLIEIYAKDKKLDKVAKLYKKLYKRDPQKYFLKKIIEISLYRKDLDGAITFLEESGDNQEILYSLYRKKDLNEKAIAITDTLYKKSKDPKWLAEKGILIFESANKSKVSVMEALKKMQTLLDEAILKGIKDSTYFNYYGYTLIDHDLDIDRGIELIKIALKKEPNNTYYLDSLAWGLYKKGQCHKSYKIMKKVVAREGLKEEEIATHWDLIQQCGREKMLKPKSVDIK